MGQRAGGMERAVLDLELLTAFYQSKPDRGLNPNKSEITNYKHQITNKFQITISKSQIRVKANCLEF
jgi:hypothetical protein